MEKHDAILIVGPTGSGKTPLGDLLEARGLRGRPCRHFDFGRQLRRAAAGELDAGLTPGERDAVRDVLDRSALLEDEQFSIARKLLGHFLETRCSSAGAPGPLVVLNGLPRHLGQARDVDDLVHVRLVVHLSCPPDVIRDRIRTNAGGDRTGRSDDHAEAIARKQRLFQERTVPLLRHYRRRGARTETFSVTLDTTAEQLRQQIEAQPDEPSRRPPPLPGVFSG